MKKTEKVNIAGVVFNLDEDAYLKLHSYLETLRKKFGAGSEANEILGDIESRIAEILLEKSQRRESVSIEEVEAVIRIMGTPEDYEETVKQEPGTDSSRINSTTVQRRLYRDPDHSVFGGVCGGLGAYFNVDPIIFRILFVALLIAWGFTFFLYIILWIALPQAVTATQKLEMRGEAINIGSIEKTIRDEYQAVVKNAGKNEGWDRVRTGISEILNAVLMVVKLILKGIGLILGFAFTIIGLALLFAFLSMVVVQKPLITGAFDDAQFYFSDLVHLFMPGTDTALLMAGVILFIGIPLIAIVYWGIKLLFKFKAQDKWLGLAFFMMWFFSAFLLVMIGVSTGERYQRNASLEKHVMLDSLKQQKLILEVGTANLSELKSGNAVFFEKDQIAFYFLRDRKQVYGRPQMQIERAEGNAIEVQISNEAQGKSYSDADAHAAKINYDWSMQDSVLHLSPLFSLPEGEDWNGSFVDIRVFMPNGSQIYIPESAELIMDYAETADWSDRHELGGKTWKMTEEGLVEIR
jgi:phage shock protein PspC (stress-responsive transcriptional regulator)